ncbi:hypothetical protein H9I27_005194 [Escherichia coli]|nr:hypothetical protein [Escherichia coli]EGC2832899.1 hypothetical protein [Escherichia coli]EGC2967212.1 hypothetical protein [Escherichia coli]
MNSRFFAVQPCNGAVFRMIAVAVRRWMGSSVEWLVKKQIIKTWLTKEKQIPPFFVDFLLILRTRSKPYQITALLAVF